MRDPLNPSPAGPSRGESTDRHSVALALEVACLATDEQDLAARHEVMADLEAVSADWPA